MALTYATHAKQRLPEHTEVNDTLGWIYLKKNLTDKAIDTFRTLVVKAPQNPTYHYHYAMALLQKGDRDTAPKECQSALADKPDKLLENADSPADGQSRLIFQRGHQAAERLQ